MSATERVDWVDVAKGICILMVVMVHATLGVEEEAGSTGFMGIVVAFARPFRMPDFFLISGLFLGLVIDRPWRRYIDLKVVHFAYFYLLWVTIQFAFKAPGMVIDDGAPAALANYLYAFIQPFSTLWFIWILPVFFLAARLLKPLPAWFVLGMAAILEILSVHTGITLVDEFTGRFVYFAAGYLLAPHVFALAAWVRTHASAVMALIVLVWAPLEAMAVFTPAPLALQPLLQPDLGFTGATGGWSELPVISLLLGAAGCMVVVSVASLLAPLRAVEPLRWLGSHSIVIYLAFFLPLAFTRTLLIKTGVIDSVGWMSVVVWLAAVLGPVALYLAIQRTGVGWFLFRRPDWAKIDNSPRQTRTVIVPAE